jgi:hypothetical protein
LCSDCNDIIRPVVVLDIDGTLGDYHGHFHAFAEAYEGRMLNPGFDGSCELHEWYNMSLDHYREIKLAYRQGGMKRSMPCYADADLLVRSLQLWGAEVWICTTRPYLRLDNIDPDTREWLARNRIHYDGLLYSENKYQRLLEIVDPARIVAVMDDLPAMLAEAWHSISPSVPILRVAPHNKAYRQLEATRMETQESDFFMPANDLRQAMHIIGHRLETWKSNVAGD